MRLKHNDTVSVNGQCNTTINIYKKLKTEESEIIEKYRGDRPW